LVPLRVTDEPAVTRGADLAVVAVKTWATAAALPPLRAHLPPTAALLTLQNGLGNAAAIRAALDDAHRPVLVGVTSQVALREAPGRVRDTGPGETVLGLDRGGTSRARPSASTRVSPRSRTRARWPDGRPRRVTSAPASASRAATSEPTAPAPTTTIDPPSTTDPSPAWSASTMGALSHGVAERWARGARPSRLELRRA
jgi:hypothetical protein